MEIEDIEKIAKKCLEESGSHSPQLIIEKKVGDKIEMIMILLCYDDETKEKMFKPLRLLINSGSVDRYFFVSEAWMSQEIHMRPSESDDKKECLVICEFRRDNKNKILFNEFGRKGKEIIFKKRLVLDKDTGMGYSRFNFFLEDVMDEHIKKVRIEESLKCVDDKMIKEVTKKAREFFKDKNISEDMMKNTITNMVKKGKIGFQIKGEKKTVYIKEDKIKNKIGDE